MKWYSTWRVQGDWLAHEELRGRALGVSKTFLGNTRPRFHGRLRLVTKVLKWSQVISLLYGELLPKGLWFPRFHEGTSLEPC